MKNTFNEEAETHNELIRELTDEDLAQITGGAGGEKKEKSKDKDKDKDKSKNKDKDKDKNKGTKYNGSWGPDWGE